MIKIDIISGFLGAGKTTLINKLVSDIYAKEKTVLIENEFGEIGIDGSFLQDSGIKVNELNSGCICCSLVGDFEKSLTEVITTYQPTRIVIEPSGVGKLSDIIQAIQSLNNPDLQLNNIFTVVDGTKVKVYSKNFGEFFNNQIEYAKTIIISRSQKIAQDKLEQTIESIKEINPNCPIISTPWDKLSAQDIENAKQRELDFENLVWQEANACPICHHEHHHEDCGCHHEHHHEDCGCHHEHHHHAGDEVFSSVGIETIKQYTKNQLTSILEKLANRDDIKILRAKGIVDSGNDNWFHFDLVPGEFEIREGHADITGRICIIGSELDRKELEGLFLG